MGECHGGGVFCYLGPFLVALLAFLAAPGLTIQETISSDAELLPEKTVLNSGDISNSSEPSFIPAGSNEVAIVGEPAHFGDYLTASILVHNQGNSSGAVSMVISFDNWSSNISGESVTITPGSSRDVSASFSLNRTGQVDIQWEIVSSVDAVSDDLTGTITVDSLPPQSLSLIVESESWTLSDGLQISISVLLSDGHPRDVEIIADLFNMGVQRGSQSHTADLSPGIRDMSFDFGNPDVDFISFSILPIGWVPSEQISVDHQLSPPVVLPSVSSCSTVPEIAIPGDSLIIDCVVANSGDSATLSGTISAIRQSDGLILSTSDTSPLSADEESIYSLVVPMWPDEGDAIVEITWNSEGISAMQSIQIQTREPPAEGFKLPFDTSAALLGSVIGLVVVMVVLAVWRVISEKTPSTDSGGTFKLRRESRIERRAEVQKVEISCPSCEQRLSVPKSHVGGVKCPSCTVQFQVGSSENIPEGDEDLSETTQATDPPTPKVSSSAEEILSCPSCEQRLKVPLDRRPVMSRCPACRTEFMALNEEVDS
ncbi:MAG: hypothetical protein CMB53_02580 [Euryarchaeota archaeon]|nr:hypothetical protein [Euryarchaeota archaeon]|tara:strand:- start:41687 stop:43309 length:1623 start_codon:yes stop_codon:yes gene_type:complete